MTQDATNQEILSLLVGRSIKEFVIEKRPEQKLHIAFEDGVVLSLWVDQDAYLCFDVDRETRQ